MGKMHSYLMSSSCFEVYFEEGIFIVIFQSFVMGNGFLTVLTHTAQNYTVLPSCKRSVNCAVFIGYSVNYGIVYFSEISLQNICGM